MEEGNIFDGLLSMTQTASACVTFADIERIVNRISKEPYRPEVEVKFRKWKDKKNPGRR